MSSATQCKAQLLAEHEARLAWEWAKQEACQLREEEEFAWEMVELELKEEEEQKAQEAEEQQVWEEEEKQLWLASKQEKRWLAELVAQRQREWMVEEKGKGSSTHGGTWNEEDRECWGCWVWEEVCKQPRY